MKFIKLSDKLFYLINILIYSICINCFSLIISLDKVYTIPVLIIGMLFVNTLPVLPNSIIPNFKLNVCYHGTAALKIFLWSCLLSVISNIGLAFYFLPDQWGLWILSIVVAIVALNVLFWNGMISVYSCSVQLGVNHRVVGILCGMVPVLNLIMLHRILKTVSNEISFETEKAILNSSRIDEQICNTKYPILLVHGVFFRDFKHLNYWGRIPDELIKNGATIFYGNHHSAASVADCAEELTNRIKEIIKETGSEKVNIIAHSKGGIDCRYAINFCGAAPYVASLTTINSPHSGCEFADYLLNKIPEGMKNKVAKTYNGTLKKLGDENPDFIAAMEDLTASNCLELNSTISAAEVSDYVYCQSVGSKLNHAINGKFPLNFTYPLVKHFDGYNDGLVSDKSCVWGERHQFLTVDGIRGISHGDMIDLNRENITGFDVREFYVQLVRELKEKGL